MSHRYFIKISFDGTAYNGWQVQKNSSNTVQAKIQNAISTILNEKTTIYGCCRTDSGVHAKELYAHFDTKRNLIDRDFSSQSNGVRIPSDKSRPTWLYKFNSLLHTDISIDEIFPVKKDADARFDAQARTYQYLIHQKRNPFLVNRSYYYYGKLNIEKMNRCAGILKKHNDFSAFSKVHKQTKTNVCNIYEAEWKKALPKSSPSVDGRIYTPFPQGRGGDELLVFTITANRFLRGMVRMIAGTMLLVGKHKITVNDFKKIIESKDCRNAGALVPSCGLYLTKVEYPARLSILYSC